MEGGPQRYLILKSAGAMNGEGSLATHSGTSDPAGLHERGGEGGGAIVANYE